MTRILTFTKIGLQDMSNIRQRDINLSLQSIYVHQDFTEYKSTFKKTIKLLQNNL